MFRRVAVDVEVFGGFATFRFPSALSVIAIVVSNGAGEMIWELVAAEMKPMSVEGWTGTVMPLSEAPAELVMMARVAEDRAQQRLEEVGPFKTPIVEVSYGILPPGYRETITPVALGPGDYRVNVFSEQGSGSSPFHVPAA